MDLTDKIVHFFTQNNYSQVITLCEQAIAESSNSKSPYWYLGLALLAQGQEEEAQITWFMAMADGEAEQIEQWTGELAAILEAEADRRETEKDFALAWTIRQHFRELCPENTSNLIRLVLLSAQIGCLTPEAAAQWGLTQQIQVAKQPIQDTDILKLLQVIFDQVLSEQTASEAKWLDLIDACLDRTTNPQAAVDLIMLRATELAYELGRPKLAIPYIEICRRLCPADLELLNHLSQCHQKIENYNIAIQIAESYIGLAKTRPDQVAALTRLLHSLSTAGNFWQRIFDIAETQRSLFSEISIDSISPPERDITLRLIMSTWFLPYLKDDPAYNRQIQNQVFQVCQASVQTYAAEQAIRYQQGLLQRSSQIRDDRRLRIGYFSHCLRRHSVGWLARWLFQYHDRDRFQIYGYFWNHSPQVQDPLQTWYLSHVDVARTLGRNGFEIAEQIYQDKIDILIDLDSVTADVASEVLALKPAPIQATWLGWDASGLPAIDYFIADPYVLPTTAEAHYSEKIWRLPQTYLAVDGFEVGVPTLRRDVLEIPTDAVVFLSAQSAYKRHPDTVRLQMQIIKAVPNSYFLVKGIMDNASIQDYFIEMAEAEGVSRDRLRFLPLVHQEEVHRANLGIADVVLDTYPYNGATTTMETLWMGIPLVTRVGQQFAARNSYTMLVNAGIEEGIAWTDEEYVEWGIRLGTDATLRQQVVWKLQRSRQTATLWNARQFTRNMETAYEQMWEIYKKC